MQHSECLIFNVEATVSGKSLYIPARYALSPFFGRKALVNVHRFSFVGSLYQVRRNPRPCNGAIIQIPTAYRRKMSGHVKAMLTILPKGWRSPQPQPSLRIVSVKVYIDTALANIAISSSIGKKSLRYTLLKGSKEESKVEVDPYLVGVILGDGSLRRYDLSIYGDSCEGSLYMAGVLSPLIQEDFGYQRMDFIVRDRSTKLQSYLILQTFGNLANLVQLLGFSQPKDKRIISDAFTEDQYPSIIRGLADTDGSIIPKGARHNSLYMRVLTVSAPLAKQLKLMLEKLGIKARCTYHYSYKGKDYFAVYTNEFEKWMVEIGFSNPAKLTKIMIYRKWGFYPSNLDQIQRVAIIEGLAEPKPEGVEKFNASEISTDMWGSLIRRLKSDFSDVFKFQGDLMKLSKIARQCSIAKQACLRHNKSLN